MIRLLIDECLTPDLVDIARARWIEANHISRIGKSGQADWTIGQFAVDSDHVLVTNNARDLRKLYRSFAIHPGLLIILPQGNAPLQIALFRKVLDYLDRHADTINRLIEIDEHGNISSTIWPA